MATGDRAASTPRRDDEIAFLSIHELVDAYRTGGLSPVEATETMLARIESLDGRINAYRTIDDTGARHAARQSEARWRKGEPLGPLDGVPLSVKDTLAWAGHACRRGSKALGDEPAAESAPIVDRAIEQGAVLLGITTTPEFGAGPVTISPLTGVTRNPWDTTKNSGGSSGGAAASVAAGMGYGALGTDAGGSIRIPSALCGVVGFKVTGGRVPSYPHNVAGPMASPGPIARTVRDTALMLNYATRGDVRDVEAAAPTELDFLTSLHGELKGLRIAYSPRLGYARRVDADIERTVAESVSIFRNLGATVEEADPEIEDPIEIFLTLFYSGFAYATRNFTDEQLGVIGEKLNEAIERGNKVSLFEFLEVHDARRALARKMASFHERFDLLMTPTVAAPAFEAERWTPEEYADIPNMRAWTPFAYPFNLTQQPAISVPCGFTRTGLPIGLQIVGPRFADALVLCAAKSFEDVVEISPRHPRL